MSYGTAKFSALLDRLTAEIEKRVAAEAQARFFEQQHMQAHAAATRFQLQAEELSEQLKRTRGQALRP